MRPAWRLAISSVSRRRSRSLLLACVVALSALLISAVGVAMGSIRAAVEKRVEALVGRADVRIKASGTGSLVQEDLLAELRRDAEVEGVAPRLEGNPALRFVRPVWTTASGPSGLSEPIRRVATEFRTTTPIYGIDPAIETSVRPLAIAEGRLPTAPDEIAVDRALQKRLSEPSGQFRLGNAAMTLLSRTSGMGIMKDDPGPETTATLEEAQRLNAEMGLKLGDRVEVIRFRQDPITLRVVGILEPPPLGGTPRGFMTVEGLARATGQTGGLSEISVVLREGVSADAFVARLNAAPPAPGLAIETTEKVTSGLNQNLRANQIGFVLATLMAFLAAGFIITTGMTTAVTEKQRELAVLRCIGASPTQLALTQLLSGLIIAGAGAVVGVPLGALGAVWLLEHYHDRVQAPPVIEAWRLALSFGGALFAGLVGATFPAIAAMRVTPLKALSARAVPPRRFTTLAITCGGIAGVLIHLAVFTLPTDGQVVFWGYVTAGLPGLMLGYFLLGVPTVLLVTRALGPVLERCLAIPPRMLRRTVEGTPYRFGFTAGAMMAGLALMVAIWTQGGAAIRDWLDRIRFPDAFVVGLNLSPEAQSTLNQLPFVKETCAISMHTVEIDHFGVRGINRLRTFFVAFEVEPFFRMTSLEWVQGDPATAMRRLEEGGAVIVSREYLAARGKGVGTTWTCYDQGKEHTFEIVGVVTSPGLEIVSDFFDVGQEMTEQRVHAVFGSRRDLRERFNSDAVGLIQIDLDDTTSDEVAMPAIREAMLPFGIMNAGSGRQIKGDIEQFIKGTLVVSSTIALFAMLVACFGVANLIVAGIQARRFEFGVLRAVGASPLLLTRMVIAEALVIAIAACILGTLMGVQGAFGGTTLNRVLWGIDLGVRPPMGPIAMGWGAIALFTLGAAAPAIVALARKAPRELLGGARG